MRYWIFPLLMLMMSNYSNATEDNTIEISLIQNDYNAWLDKGKTFIKWDEIIKKSPENAVTPDEVQKDFEENQVLFYKKYSNKWFRIKGSVQNVQIENNELFINLNSKYHTFRAYTEQTDYASELRKNDQVDLYCFNGIHNKKILVPYSASKCMSYGAYILKDKATAKEYFDKVKLSEEYKEIQLISSILYKIVPKDKLNQYCTSLKNNDKCVDMLNNSFNDPKSLKTLEKISKDCKKSESKTEKCLEIEKFLKGK
ncbi:hypothetical protein Q5X40_16915 [Acinetobacter baumannii]|uniref:hypothetical protein n=2 Tax=Acinetobacter baumannii TaxID=470 RepID=UPI00034B3D53|nr:hypothetical protein [Acinetobacter baumannii]MDK6142541.1 hypothetical protein [Acinetobacter baumannii]MDO7381558.1 hypothetical protein [Acinetobacter baumannii]HEE6388754.1 hypothetical protein [Acinetobacter baumannii]